MSARKHLATQWYRSGGGSFLKCHCGEWRSDLEQTVRAQRDAHRAHRVEMGETVAPHRPTASERLIAAEAAVARVDANHQPKAVTHIYPCTKHAGGPSLRMHENARDCPDCEKAPETICSNLTCCGWPCRDHLALHDETEATCVHAALDDTGEAGRGTPGD